jgi:bifunctional ADP-heptose synthase (sugar kinase/adenylyltransferase)
MQTMISSQRLDELLDRFRGHSIGLVGDLFLDRYLDVQGDVRELSIETGLEAYQVFGVRNSPGALGTVMNNLAALGVGRLVPVTVIGDDGHGDDLLRELQRLPVECAHVIRDPQRLTPTYTKPVRQVEVGAGSELNRLDIRTRGPLDRATAERLAEHVREVFSSTNGLIVLDQVYEDDWGVVGVGLRELLGELANKEPRKLMFIDSRHHLGAFSFGTLKGNRAEVLAATGSGATVPVHRAARLLSGKTACPVFTTLGSEGISVAFPDGRYEQVAGIALTGPLDIVGAGDAATSGIVASLLSGADEYEAAAVGNLVASITVQQLNTTGCASPAQVRARRREAYRG